MDPAARPPRYEMRDAKNCSRLRVEQPPGHGADFVEEPEGGVGSRDVDCSRSSEQTQVGVDLLGRGIGYPPVVDSVAPYPSVTLREIRRNRARRPDDLIGEAFEWCRNPHSERQRYAGSLEGLVWAVRLLVWRASSMITSGSFMPPSEPVWFPMSRVAERPAPGRPALDLGNHTGYLQPHERPGGDHPEALARPSSPGSGPSDCR